MCAARKKQEPELEELFQYLKDNNPYKSPEWTGVAYYFTDAKGRLVKDSIQKAICFAPLMSEYRKAVEFRKAKYVVYVPRFVKLKKELCLEFLEKVVGKFHFFKDVIEDFDPERIYKERKIVIDGTKWSYTHFLAATSIVRYLDEYPQVVEKWHKLITEDKRENNWKTFFEAHKEVKKENGYTAWGHALFSPDFRPTLRKEPKVTDEMKIKMADNKPFGGASVMEAFSE